METQTLLSYIFLLIGIIDFVVVPRILISAWRKAGVNMSNRGMVIRAIRLSGLVFVVLGILFYYRILTV